jgi:RND family efflux transporter MFP subunit
MPRLRYAKACDRPESPLYLIDPGEFHLIRLPRPGRFLTCLTLCCGLAAGIARADDGGAVPVQAAALRAASWRQSIEVAARIDAAQNATLAAERAGRVTQVLYSSGETVPAGAVLVRLDAAPEAAQLALDEAKLTEAQDALARETKLLSIAGASRAALEQAQADAAEAKAQTAYDQAMLAQLDVTAPFAGTLGIRDVAAGDYVQQGQMVARITQLAPLRVLFSVPQTEAGGIAVGESFGLTAPSLAGTTPSVTGKITALSPQIDAATNARDAEGEVTDPSGALLPGMFGTVSLATGAPQAAFALPATALNDSMLGAFVFVLDPAKADYVLRTVYVTKLGDAGDDSYVSAAGLHAGQMVLAIGGFKFSDGASVKLQSP